MRDIATATLSGNLTRDVELKQLPSGAEVARLRVASTARRRNGEEWVDKTNYFTIEVFGAQARACSQYLGKGSRVVVEAEPTGASGPTSSRTSGRRSRSGPARCCSRAAPAPPADRTGAEANGSPTPASPRVEVGATAPATDGAASAGRPPVLRAPTMGELRSA